MSHSPPPKKNFFEISAVYSLDGALEWAEKSFPKLQNESVGVYTSFNETSNKSEDEMTTNEKNLWTANQEKQKLEKYLIG